MTNNEEYINLIKDWIRPLQKALTLESENRFTNLLGNKQHFNAVSYTHLTLPTKA